MVAGCALLAVCVAMWPRPPPTIRGGGSLSWQRVPLSHLALPINRDVQYIAVIMYSAVISIIMHCTSRLTGHARRDNGRHCQDNALPPPRRVGVAVYYTHISGHPSAAGRAQDSESTPAKDRRYTTGPRNQELQILLRAAC